MSERVPGVTGPGAWPWVAGVLVLGLLLWGLTRLLDGGAPLAADPPAASAPR